MSDSDATVPARAIASAGEPFDGDRVGRYLLLRELGRGAMGRVFAGFDPELQRSVAVKLVQDGKHELDAYLLREGRTLAALSHPHIVPVFDIGRAGDRVYVVMELVDGASLAAWLEAETRSTRAIVRAWCEAGRGLAAAHAAGVVHRDFKGSNVLVGRDGRVRVADFGLARTADPAGGAAARPYEGTKAYMAPEVLASGAATEAVDQYAFCKSLERALAGRKLSRRLRDAIARGLADAPDARWPGMAPLVDALEASQRTPRALFAAGGLAGVAAVAVVTLAITAEPECETPDAVIARVVGTTQLDLAAWSARYAAACTNEPLARCLEDRLVDLSGVLADVAIDPADQRLVLAQWNSEVDACLRGGAESARESREYRHAMARARWLSGTWRPAEAIAAAELAITKAQTPRENIRARVVRLQVEQGADPAPFEAIYADALASDDPQLPGDVAVAAAEHCMTLEAPCSRTWIARLVERMERVPSAEQEAQLFGLRGDVAVLDGNEEVAAGLYAEEVRRKIALFGEHSWGVLPGLIDHAGTLYSLGRYAESFAVAKRADAIIIRWVGEDHAFRSTTLWMTGNARLGLGHRREARGDFERALALKTAYAADDERAIASLLSSLAGTYEDDGELVRALELVDRGIAMHERSKAPDDGYHVAMIRHGAVLAANLGQDPSARIARGFELAPSRLSAQDPLWADLHTTRAIARSRAGDLDGAEADMREALARLATLPGDRSGRVARAESRLAGIALRRKRPRDARAALDRARAALGSSADSSAVYLVYEAEYARATGGDLAALRAKLVAMFDPDKHTASDPRLAAHALAVAGDRDRAVAVLRTAGVRESALAEDCITCP